MVGLKIDTVIQKYSHSHMQIHLINQVLFDYDDGGSGEDDDGDEDDDSNKTQSIFFS